MLYLKIIVHAAGRNKYERLQDEGVGIERVKLVEKDDVHYRKSECGNQGVIEDLFLNSVFDQWKQYQSVERKFKGGEDVKTPHGAMIKLKQSRECKSLIHGDQKQERGKKFIGKV